MRILISNDDGCRHLFGLPGMAFSLVRKGWAHLDTAVAGPITGGRG